MLENKNCCFQMLMAKCQTVLENADTPELLIAIVDVISHIVKVRPQCFQRHFRVGCLWFILQCNFGVQMLTQL